MTFISDSTDPLSNSYVTLAEVSAYIDFIDSISGSGIKAKYDAFTQPVKEELAMFATSLLDIYVDWYGVKTISDSLLRWPRTGVVNLDGQLIDPDIYPQLLVKATLETINYVVSSKGFNPQEISSLEQIKLSTLMLKFNINTESTEFNRFIVSIIGSLGVFLGGNGNQIVQVDLQR